MDAPEESPALSDALVLLHKASQTPAKQRTVKLSSIVDVICQHAFRYGLDNESLREIVQLTSVKTHLDQTSVTALVKNLYPTQRVPGNVIVTIVGALGQGKGKPSPGTQDNLVRWLIIVHEIIEDPTILSRLYGVLFGLLDTMSIRTSICHLLSLITRRKHVKPFRIQQILELSRGLGNEPALQGLLRVYKDYYPEIILGSTSTSRKSFAPRPDPEWQTKISAIQDLSTTSDGSRSDIQNGFKVLRKGPKRGRATAIPDVHTYHATETSVTLEGIDNVEDFVEKLDRIEPPGQLISFLTDPLLQKYVELRPSPIVATRIDLWLGTCLEEQYAAERQGTGDIPYASEVLAGLLRHAQYTKQLHPTILRFLADYLPTWNGHDHVDTILGLLSHLNIESFTEVYTTYFLNVERALSTQDPSAYAMLIDFYSTLLQKQITQALIRGVQPSPPDYQVFEKIVDHVNSLVTSLVLSLPHTTSDPLSSSILSFYELLSRSSVPHTVPILLPPMHLVYMLSHNASSATISRICGIISTYKVAFDNHPKPVKAYFPTIMTDIFNLCLRDIYNLFWVARALTVTENKSLGCYCDPALRSTLNTYLNGLDREYAIGTTFGLSNSAWLASMSATAWHAIEERQIAREGFDRNSIRYHQGPVNQRSLEVLNRQGGVHVEWDSVDGYKVFVLRWLAERGLSGLKTFMFATVTAFKGKV